MFSFNFLFVLRFHTNHSTKEHRKIIILKTYFSLPKINLITESLLRCKQLTAGEATAAGKLAVSWKTHNHEVPEDVAAWKRAKNAIYREHARRFC